MLTQTSNNILTKISHVKTATDISSVIPSDLLKKHLLNGGGTKFFLPECVFKPDTWTTAFLHGLHEFGKRGSFDGKTVVELGTGSGINLVLLKSVFDPRKIYGSDIHPDVPEVAKRNAAHNLFWRKKPGVDIIGDGHNLGQWMEPGFKADVIFGCLPQVVAPIEVQESFTDSESEATSHYYCVDDYPMASKESHQWGLGLNDQALKELRWNLVPGGHVLLNLGGRPGKDRLLELFQENGYEANILHSETVPQHEGTDISTLVQREASFPDDRRFEFFESTGKQISAAEAQEVRKSGGEIYHKIYVIAGQKK